MADTISLPALLLILIITTGLLARHLVFRSPSSTSDTASSSGNTARAMGNGRSGNTGSNAATRRRDATLVAAVEQVAAVFPHVERRTLAWELRRNGGSVAAASERILGGGLEMPPPSFQPSFLSSSPASSTSASASSPSKNSESLIQRYNLTSKLNDQTASSSDGALQAGQRGPEHHKTSGWAPSKEQRAALLAQRREEMILGARRRLAHKEASS